VPLSRLKLKFQIGACSLDKASGGPMQARQIIE